jgi:hypothetical protein
VNFVNKQHIARLQRRIRMAAKSPATAHDGRRWCARPTPNSRATIADRVVFPRPGWPWNTAVIQRIAPRPRRLDKHLQIALQPGVRRRSRRPWRAQAVGIGCLGLAHRRQGGRGGSVRGWRRYGSWRAPTPRCGYSPHGQPPIACSAAVRRPARVVGGEWAFPHLRQRPYRLSLRGDPIGTAPGRHPATGGYRKPETTVGGTVIQAVGGHRVGRIGQRMFGQPTP